MAAVPDLEKKKLRQHVIQQQSSTLRGGRLSTKKCLRLWFSFSNHVEIVHISWSSNFCHASFVVQ